MTSRRISWFSIPGLSVLLIFLNALIPMPVLVGIQFIILMYTLKKIRIVYSLPLRWHLSLFNPFLP